MVNAIVSCLRLVLESVLDVSVLSFYGLGQSLMFQVAKKASVLKRRKSKNRMERSDTLAGTPGTPQQDVPAQQQLATTNSRCESESDIIYYMEEPKAGRWYKK